MLSIFTKFVFGIGFIALLNASALAQPTTGLIMRLQADTGVTTDSQGRLVHWDDTAAGQDHDAFQPITWRQPILVPNARFPGPGGTFVEFPVIRFDGRYQYLNVANGGGILGSPITVVVVAKRSGTDPYESIIMKGAFKTGWGITKVGSKFGFWTNSYTKASANTIPAQLSLMIGQYDGIHTDFWLNGVNQGKTYNSSTRGFTSTNVPVSIPAADPDPYSTTESSLSVPDAGIVGTAFLTTEVVHTNPLDLEFGLKSPDGTTVLFDGFVLSPIIINDLSFSMFTGENASGAWKLIVRDDDANTTDTGQIKSWALRLSTVPTKLTDPIYIGAADALGRHLLRGDVAEILIYDRILTEDERHQLEAYALAEFGVQALVPNTPVISPPTGLYDPAPAVTITSTGASKIFYTLDGSNPYVRFVGPLKIPQSGNPPAVVNASSRGTIEYTGTVPAGVTVVKSVAANDGGFLSSLSEAYYGIGNTLADIPATGLNLWLRADFAQFNPAKQVHTWLDLSTNQALVIQPLAHERPIVRTAITQHYDRTAVPPGWISKTYQTVKFDGINDRMLIPDQARLFTSPFTLITVVKNGRTTFEPVIMQGTWTAGWGFTQLTTNKWGMWLVNYFDNVAAASPINVGSYMWTPARDTRITTAPTLIMARYDGTNLEFWVDGQLKGFDVFSGEIPFGQGPVSIGGQPTGSARPWFSGEIAEIILYDAALSETDRTTIEDYYRDRYLPPAP
jgi:subtilisin-like proprotein convertase family protein